MRRARATYRHGPSAPGRSPSASAGPSVDRTSDAAFAAAEARVRALLDRLARVELQLVVVAPPDLVRLEAQDRARSAAVTAGRSELLDDAVAAVRESVMRAFSRGGFSGTWALTDMAASVVRSEDRVATSAALEEAAMAEVVEDLVDPDTLHLLRSTAGSLIDMTGLIVPGSLAAIAAPGVLPDRWPIQIVIVLTGLLVCVALFLWGAAGAVASLALGLAIATGLRRRRRPIAP